MSIRTWLCGGIVAVLAGVLGVPAGAEETAEELLAKESAAKCTETAKDKPTPAMIIEKVNKAAALVEQEGEAAFAKFKGKSSDFLFCGTYIWIHNLDGVMLMHPIKPKMEGKPQLNLKSSDGKLIFVEMNKLVQEKGAGWYQYDWPKPGEKEPSKKVSFVKLLKKGDKSYVVGCGVYDMTLEEAEKASAGK